ncbi:MAG: GGDEF domain-containing protein [Treponema sp.]|nr:GGDEF domain-containing protein [Treponema sp.]
MDTFFSKNSFPIDELTRLYNREVILNYMEYLIENRTPFTIALLDIDNFKYINDSYGHIAGDKILCEVAERVNKLIGENGVVGRFGGDEFIVILKNVIEYDKLWNICHNLLVKMREVEIPNFSGLYVTVTIGLSRFPENEKESEKLMIMADKALYRGKTKGRNCFIIYLPEKHANIVLKNEKEKQLSSMYLHSVVFSHLTQSTDLKTGITNLFNFLSSYFMIDHICIQTEDQLLFQTIHILSKNKTFARIPNQLIRSNINKTIDIFYVNDIKPLVQSSKIDLYNMLQEQEITSTCYADISYCGNSFGFIRIDMTGLPDSFRIWQHTEMDIFMTTAKMIATILHFTGQNLSEL